MDHTFYSFIAFKQNYYWVTTPPLVILKSIFAAGDTEKSAQLNNNNETVIGIFAQLKKKKTNTKTERQNCKLRQLFTNFI